MLFVKKIPNINYVIAAWSGPRRIKDKRYIADRTIYLKKHLAVLQKLNFSNIAQITIVLPKNAKEPAGFRSIIPAHIKDIPVVIMDRPNIGLSYGSFSDAFCKYRSQFSHYFFMEDDYILCQDHFDDIFLGYLQDEVGFVCGLYERGHAAIFLGLLNSNALEGVWQARGRLPHADSDKYHQNEMSGQIGQSRAIIEAGYKLRDVTDVYCVGYRTAGMKIRWYGNGPVLIKPI